MKQFFHQLNTIVKPGRLDIIEKDYHLHRLLYGITFDEQLKNSLVLKGGTCLIKAYLGYYRFSEDIDFTWKDTTLWKQRTPSQTRKECSKQIDRLLLRIKNVATSLGLIFKGEKTDSSQVEIGSGGRMARFFIGYTSELSSLPSTIKVEINFVDTTLYPYQSPRLHSIIKDVQNKELMFLFKEAWQIYQQPLTFACYDPQEIYTDKVRAVMTRMTYKFRDIIDIYMLEKHYGYSLENYKKSIQVKTQFVLDLYSRYNQQIQMTSFPSLDQISDEEYKLLLYKPPKDFQKEIRRIQDQIQRLQDEIIREQY